MASLRKPKSTDASAHPLEQRVLAELSQWVRPGSIVLAGFSGGLDSSVLLTLLSRIATDLKCSVRAVHVHHGLSPLADEWVSFCAERCAGLQIPFAVERVDVNPYRDLGREGAARAARYAAFARHPADALALAHQRNDQAETVVIQLLRGAGPAGLAAMPSVREANGAPWSLVVRPLLDATRHDIESYATEHRIPWIEDDSNKDTTLDRNFLRHAIMPLLEARFPGAVARIARSAVLAAEASALLDELGREDLKRLLVSDRIGEAVDLAALRGLGDVRARNALRAWFRARSVEIPGAAALQEVLRQLVHARDDATPRMDAGDHSLLRYRGFLYLERARAIPTGYSAPWHGEDRLPLVSLGGVLHFKAEEGRGVDARRLRDSAVSIRLRRGGERLRLVAHGPSHSLKNLLQARGVPPWRRSTWPMLYSGEELVCVPGVGEQPHWLAPPGTPGVIISWEAL